jgi:RHS repeat-associated protein
MEDQLIRVAFLLLLIGSLCASEAPNAYCMAATEGEPSALVEGCVSAITGDFYNVTEDLVVQGAEPIRIYRSYLSHKEAQWTIVPHAQVRPCYEPNLPCTYVITEPNGSEIFYERKKIFQIDGAEYARFEPNNLNKGFSNTSQGKISSYTNRKNNYFILDQPKQKFLTLYCSDGTVRSYKHDPHAPTFYLLSEKLPNGNWVLYEHTDVDKHEKKITSIRTTNPDQTKTYAQVWFSPAISAHPQNLITQTEEYKVTTSDGRILVWRYEPNSWNYLQSVVSPELPDVQYKYINSALRRPNGKLLTSWFYPLERKFHIDYYLHGYEVVNDKEFYLHDEKVYDAQNNEFWILDPRKGRVKTLSAPIGTDASLHTTHWFIYDVENRKTSIYDIEQSRTDYFWNEDLRLEKIERFGKDSSLKAVEKFVWEESNLAVKTLLDGQRKPISTRRYFYDDKGNVTENRLYGNLSGQGTTLVLNDKGYPVENGVERFSTRFKYLYENHISYLIREETDAGLVIVHEYLPGTQLPTAEFTYDKDVLRRQHRFEYNQDHILVADISDERIVRITPVASGPYIGMPRVIEEKDSQDRLLKKTVLSYTTGGKIEKRDTYDADGVFRFSLKFAYDNIGRLISQTNAIGQEETFSYDACNNLVSHKPTSERISITNLFDCANRLVFEQTHGDDGIALETRYAYDLKSRKISEEKPFGNTTFYRYDSAGFLSEKQTGPYRYRYTHDALGHVISAAAPDGALTKTTRNARSQQIRVEHPDAGIEQWSYSLDGAQASYTDPAGVKTAYAHDFLGRMTSKMIGSDCKEEWIYDGRCLLQHTDAEGYVTSYEYDSAGRQCAEKRGDRAVFFSYDSLGRKWEEQEGDLFRRKDHDLLDRVVEEAEFDAKGHLFTKLLCHYNSAGLIDSTTRFIDRQTAIEHLAYDSLGRPIENTDACAFTTTTRYEHLPDGCRITTTDPTGLQTIQRYDSLKRLITSDIPGFLHEEFTHDFRDNILTHISQTSERTCRIEKTFDSMGRLTLFEEPLGKTTTHRYNTAGLLIQTTKPDNTRLNYTYTPLRHLKSLVSSDRTIYYTYHHDRLGRLIRSTDETTALDTFRTYDPHSNLLSETLANGLTLHSTYDSQSRRTSLTPSNRSLITYTHDSRFLRTITCKDWTHHFTTYDLSGRLTNELNRLGSVRKQYNPTGALDSISSSHLFHAVLKRDPVGNILQTNEASYTYDPLHQLTSETNHTYTYDAHHCRLSKDEEYYQTNQLLQLPECMRYDSNGNPLSFKDAVVHYDALDRPVEITTSAHVLHFTYDSDHRRLSKTTTDHATGTIRTELYLYDGQCEIGMANSDGIITQLRILGLPIHAEIGAAIAMELDGKLFVPLHDLFGNVRKLVNAESNAVAAAYHYGVFGEEPAPPVESTWFSWPVLTTAEPLPQNPWRYASKRIDDEFGWIWFGRRYYQPEFGRWLTPDPAGHTSGVNLYSFVRNNPLGRVDEFGLIDHGQYDRHEGEWQINDHTISCALVRAGTDFVHGAAYMATTDPILSSLGFFGLASQPLHEQFLHDLRSWVYSKTMPAEENALYHTVYWTGSFLIGSLLEQGAVKAASFARWILPSERALVNSAGALSSSKAFQSIEVLQDTLSVGKYTYTDTVAKHISEFVRKGPNSGRLSRPYMQSQLMIEEIMAAGKPILDPGGIPGALRWDVPGAMRGNKGTWELVMHPETNIIYHFNFSR